MKVYLLIDKKTGELKDVFKYEDVALSRTEENGIKGAFRMMTQGHSEQKYRVEVRKVIE